MLDGDEWARLRPAVGQRERLYPPRVTLGLWIEQLLSSDQACQDAVGRALSQRTALGLSACSLNTGPYCKARRRLCVDALSGLAGALARQAEQGTGRWRGYRVKLVDGTTVSMPDTVGNQAAFPQSSNQLPGVGFPIARIVGVVSLASGCALSWRVGPCQGVGSAESMQLWALLDQFEPGDLIIADRGFVGYFLLAALHQRGIHFLLRDHAQRKDDPEAVVRAPDDQHFLWRKPRPPAWMDPVTYEALPAQMRLRQVRDRRWRLVTNLPDPATPAELGKLYAQRWNIELDFRVIKSVLQMDVLRCKTPAMIHKEIAAYLLAYNLIRALMLEAAAASGTAPRRLSFTAARRAVVRFQEALRHDPNRPFEQTWDLLMRSIAAAVIPIRPGRFEPRQIKRRPKPRELLSVPRAVAREHLRNTYAMTLR